MLQQPKTCASQVYLGSFRPFAKTLPYRRSIDWSQRMLFAGEMSCLAANGGRVAKALGQWLDHVTEFYGSKLRDMRDEGRAIFVRHLSWARGGGAVDTLLDEVHSMIAGDDLDDVPYDDDE